MLNQLDIKLYELQSQLITLQQFKEWLYANALMLEGAMDKEIYDELLSFNYQSKYAKQNFYSSVIEKCINWKRYETWRLYWLLDSIANKAEDYASSLVKTYDLYCKGYYFLENLAIKYGLKLAAAFDGPIDNWDEIPEEQKLKLLGGNYKPIALAAQEVKAWLQKELIVLTGKQNKENGLLIFEDFR